MGEFTDRLEAPIIVRKRWMLHNMGGLRWPVKFNQTQPGQTIAHVRFSCDLRWRKGESVPEIIHRTPRCDFKASVISLVWQKIMLPSTLFYLNCVLLDSHILYSIISTSFHKILHICLYTFRWCTRKTPPHTHTLILSVTNSLWCLLAGLWTNQWIRKGGKKYICTYSSCYEVSGYKDVFVAQMKNHCDTARCQSASTIIAHAVSNDSNH